MTTFKDKPIVSIIMACYNHKSYVEKAINSVLMQKVDFPIEVWLGDDCSPDGTGDLLREIEPTLPEWFHIVYREKNVGGSANAFDLYNRAMGKYVISLECDDYWTYEYKLQKQVDFLETHSDYIAVGHNTCVVDEFGNKINNYAYPECKDEDYTLDNFLKGEFAGQTATLLSRSYLKGEYGPYFRPTVPYAAGDQTKNFLFASWAKVFCIQQDWSCYRYVTTHGSSYSANILKDNQAGKKKIRYLLERYYFAKQYLDDKSIIVSEKILVLELFYIWSKFKSSGLTYSELYDFFRCIRYKKEVFIFLFNRIFRKEV